MTRLSARDISREELSDVVDEFDAGCRELHVVTTERADGDGAGGDLVGTDDHGDGGAAAIRALHLALHAALLVGTIRTDAGGTQFGGDRERFAAAGGVHHE